ncbi:MAG: hypothetical protein GYA21_02270 [Myxococcales bacterium]|nr:hypothetical protein [Myxococcales bacterium]
MTRKALIATVVFTLLPTSGRAQSDFSTLPSYQPLLLGLRTAGMGGAAAAFGEDGAMPWVNPAGVARAGRSNLSLSANAWSMEKAAVPSMLAIGGPLAESSSRGTSSEDAFFPSGVSFSFFLDPEYHHVLALSMLTPNRGQRNLTSETAADAGQTVAKLTFTQVREFTQYEFGPTYSYCAGNWSAGLSVFLRYLPITFVQTTNATGYRLDGHFMFGPDSRIVDAMSLDLDLVAGVQAGPFWDGFFAGAAVHGRSIHLSGHFNQSFQHLIGNANTDELMIEIGKADIPAFEVRTPFWFSLGLGYQRPGRFAVAADVNLYLPQGRYQNLSGAQAVRVYTGTESFRTEGRDLIIESEQDMVVNVSVGGEVQLLDRIALRAGFFTDFAANTDPGDDGLLEDAGNSRMHRYGGTLGLGYTGQTAQFQLALMYLYGTGRIMAMNGYLESNGTINRSYAASDFSSHTVTLSFSGRIDIASLFSSMKAAASEEIGRLGPGA